jgi:DNA-binding NtrC family response regulator
MNTEQAIHILLVDDDPDLLQVLKAIIQRGFSDDIRIRTANDPKDALQQLDAEIVDVLVTDLEMPGISGLELLRRAKRRNAWTQVLLVTGHSSLDSVTEAMDLGASDYLLKPFTPGELKEVVDGTLSRIRRWRFALAGALAIR